MTASSATKTTTTTTTTAAATTTIITTATVSYALQCHCSYQPAPGNDNNNGGVAVLCGAEQK